MNEYGKLPEVIAKACQLGKQVSCNIVTKSSMARLFNWFSWSEIGFLYFLGMFLLFSLGNLSQKSNETANILLILNVMALPYTIFSVCYQAFVVRKWCVLCLVVMTSFWVNTLFSYLITDFTLSKQTLFLLMFSFLLPIDFWFILKYFLKNSQKTLFLEKQIQMHERSYDLFSAFLNHQKKKEIGYIDNEIVMGNPEAETTILNVCNPFCKPCAMAHKEIERLVSHFDDIRWIVRFIGDSEEESKRNQVIRTLFSIEPTLQTQALHDWFETMEYDAWGKKYSVEISQESLASLKEQNLWAKTANILYTPTVFLDGVELITPYDYTKLKYHLRNILYKASPTNA